MIIWTAVVQKLWEWYCGNPPLYWFRTSGKWKVYVLASIVLSIVINFRCLNVTTKSFLQGVVILERPDIKVINTFLSRNCIVKQGPSTLAAWLAGLRFLRSVLDSTWSCAQQLIPFQLLSVKGPQLCWRGGKTYQFSPLVRNCRDTLEHPMVWDMVSSGSPFLSSNLSEMAQEFQFNAVKLFL